MEILERWNIKLSDMQLDKTDPRVRNWFLMHSPKPTYMILISYILFVKIIGPKLMQDRKPFKLEKIIIGYNIFQVCLSLYLFYEACMAGWVFGGYNWRCEPMDLSNTPHALRVASVCYWYFLSKFTELLDTVFFVLRKKNKNISFLHLVHHTLMPFGCYFGMALAPSGHGTFFGFLNVFVHIIMYSYYLLAALGPTYQKFLWWKKYLTVLQIVQFVAVLIHTAQIFFTDCNYPRILALIMMAYATLFTVLFTNFYIKAYMRKDKVKSARNNKEEQDLVSKTEKLRLD